MTSAGEKEKYRVSRGAGGKSGELPSEMFTYE